MPCTPTSEAAPTVHHRLLSALLLGLDLLFAALTLLLCADLLFAAFLFPSNSFLLRLVPLLLLTLPLFSPLSVPLLLLGLGAWIWLWGHPMAGSYKPVIGSIDFFHAAFGLGLQLWFACEPVWMQRPDEEVSCSFDLCRRCARLKS